eukprot:gene22846-22846_t
MINTVMVSYFVLILTSLYHNEILNRRHFLDFRSILFGNMRTERCFRDLFNDIQSPVSWLEVCLGQYLQMLHQNILNSQRSLSSEEYRELQLFPTGLEEIQTLLEELE